MNEAPKKSGNLTRALMYALVASVVAAVVLGIRVVLRDRWNWMEVRVILTTITIAAASILGLACDYSRTAHGLNIFPRLGMALTALAAVLWLTGIWNEPNSDWFWKWTACSTAFAIATAHVCLLSLARLSRRLRWVFAVAAQVIFGLAALVSAIVLWEGRVDSTEIWKYVAALSIVAAGFTLLIPILHRLSRLDPTTDAEAPLTLLDANRLAAIDGEIAQLKKRLAELEKLRASVGREG